jgi:L-ribulokinase
MSAGGLTAEWAKKLGLTEGTTVAVGAFDDHMGAVGGCITGGTLVKIMGTSTCDVLVAPRRAVGSRCIAGICGQVDGSVIPGMVGLEAGQSAFGDVYAWFRDLLSWPLADAAASARGAKAAAIATAREEIEEHLLERLAAEAEKIDPAQSSVAALDWLNGRRTPFADQTLKGAIVGLALGTTAPKIFRALVEATAFGSLAIVEQFRREGVAVKSVIAQGGIARKSPFVMQVTADVLGMPIRVVASDQATALGAAMLAAVAAGVYPTVAAAQKRMGSGFDRTITPNKARSALYRRLYERYTELGRSLEPLLRTL